MLDYDLYLPPEGREGVGVAVLLHGRGSHKGDLQGLRRAFPPGTALVTPQAPFPGLPWGYGPGWAWYRYLGDDRVDEQSVTHSLQALGEFLRTVPEIVGFAPEEITLGGFSQGASLSLAYALQHPQGIARVVHLSGFLIREPTLTVAPEALSTLRIFWGHGTDDLSVPYPLVETGRRSLLEMGANVTIRDYPMGHQVSWEELGDLSEWLTDQGAERRPPERR